MTPTPVEDVLAVGKPFDYTRLSQAMVLTVLDDRYRSKTRDEQHSAGTAGSIPTETVLEAGFADIDAADRESELTGAVKLVTSLAAVDGAVLLRPDLRVVGFGVKIGAGPAVAKVYAGAEFERRGTKASTLDVAGFGTRHGSVLRYCKLDENAMGVVVSQDGAVRFIMSVDKSLTMWDDVKLLGHHDYNADVVKRFLKRRERRAKRKQSVRMELGYTRTPKTLATLKDALKSRSKPEAYS